MPEDLRQLINDTERKRILAIFTKWRWFFIVGIALFGIASLVMDIKADWSTMPTDKGSALQLILVLGVCGTVIPSLVFWKFPNATVLERIEQQIAQGNPAMPVEVDLLMPPLIMDSSKYHPVIAGVLYARLEYLFKMAIFFSLGLCGFGLSLISHASIPALLSVPVSIWLMHRQPFLVDKLISSNR